MKPINNNVKHEERQFEKANAKTQWAHVTA